MLQPCQHAVAAPPACLQVYKALYDGVQVVAAKVLTGLADERVFQSFVREVGGQGREQAGHLPGMGANAGGMED